MDKYVMGAFIFCTIGLSYWALIDISKSRFKNPAMKTIWFIVVLFTNALGAIFYFQLKRKFTIKKRRLFQPNFIRK